MNLFPCCCHEPKRYAVVENGGSDFDKVGKVLGGVFGVILGIVATILGILGLSGVLPISLGLSITITVVGPLALILDCLALSALADKR